MTSCSHVVYKDKDDTLFSSGLFSCVNLRDKGNKLFFCGL